MKAAYLGMTLATATGILWVILSMASCQKTEAGSDLIEPRFFDNVNGVACYTWNEKFSCVKL
jgi:hypothetical protein